MRIESYTSKLFRVKCVDTYNAFYSEDTEYIINSE